MKILLSRFAQTYGGAERSFAGNARALQMCDQKVLALTNLDEVCASLKPQGVPVKKIHFLTKTFMTRKLAFILLGLPVFAVQMLVRLAVFKPDIIYAHSRIDQVFWTKTKWLHRLPVFWKDPSDLAWTFEVEPNSFYGKLHIEALSHCDGLYILSEKYLERLESSLPSGSKLPKNLTIAPSGIIPSDYKIKKREPKSPVQIVSVGRLHKKKGFATLLKAIATIKDKDFELTIAGDGEELDSLLRMRDKLGLEERVTFLGAVDNITDLLNSSDVFVSAAEVEPWGLALAEARLFGKAIVATPTEGAYAQLKNNQTALVTQTFSAQDIASALAEILDNQDLMARLSNATSKHIKDVDLAYTVKTKILPALRVASGRK